MGEDIAVRLNVDANRSDDEFYALIPNWPAWLTDPSSYEGGAVMLDGYFTRLGEFVYSVTQSVDRGPSSQLQLQPQIKVYRLRRQFDPHET
jgi:hypothetical protein